MGEKKRKRSDMKIREDGFYWVRQYGYWTIGEFTAGHGWLIVGSDETGTDDDFEFIGEARIKRITKSPKASLRGMLQDHLTIEREVRTRPASNDSHWSEDWLVVYFDDEPISQTRLSVTRRRNPLEEVELVERTDD